MSRGFLLFLPLLPFVLAIPLDGRSDIPLRIRDATVTQMYTATSVVVEVVTATTTLASSMKTALAAPQDEQEIFFLPPDAPPPGIAGLSDPSSTLTTSSSQYPSATPFSDPDVFQNSTTPADATKPLQSPLVMVYYPDWVAGAFPPEKVDFGRIDWVDFAFAVPKADFSLGWDGADDAPAVLNRLVKAAHQHGKKVKLSIGGWTGSKYFSPAVATDQSRQQFVSNILALYQQHSLDGIDIDWEYPGQAGAGDNDVDKGDSQNFLAFLQLLRSRLPPVARISAAAQTVPFADQSGNPIKDARAFANVLDWVLMMNYDVWGASSTPGPNAPFRDDCHDSTQPDANAEAAINAWTSAGFPANKLVLGLPAYGYVSRSTATRLRQRDFEPDFFPAVTINAPSVSTSSEMSSSPVEMTSSSTRCPESSMSATSSSAALSTSSSIMSSTSTSYVPEQTSSPDDGTGVFPGSNTTFPEDPAKQTVHLKTDDGPQIQFRDLVRQGALCAPKGGNGYVGCGGFDRHWDECSSTPWLRSASAGQIVTYDDEESLGLKAQLVRQRGVLGVNVFDVSGDTDQWVLVDAIRKGLGK